MSNANPELNLIPENLIQHGAFANFLIKPPSVGSQPKLIDRDTTTVSGIGSQQGYSVAARIIDLERVKENKFLPIVVNSADSRNPDIELPNRIALHLLVDAFINTEQFDSMPASLSISLANIISTYVPFEHAVHLAREKNTSTAIFTLAPHLCLVLAPSPTAIKKSTFFSRLGTRKTTKPTTTEIVETVRKHKEPILIIDASGKSKKEQIFPLVELATRNGVQPILVGPQERTANILTGNTYEITWTGESLLSLSTQAINELSSGEFDSLSYRASRDVRALSESPEELVVDHLIKTGNITPMALIKSLNDLIRAITRNHGELTMDSLQQVLKR